MHELAKSFLNQGLDEISVGTLLGELELAPNFRWHPNGFTVWSKHLSPERGTIRLHCWPRGKRHHQEPNWPIHNHSWHLRSFVLAGSLQHSIYELHSDGDKPLYEVSYSDGLSRLTRCTRNVTLRKVHEDLLVERDYYELETDAYHSIVVAEDQFAATLVLSAPQNDSIAYVVGDSSGPNELRFERKEVDRRTVRACLDSIKSRYLRS